MCNVPVFEYVRRVNVQLSMHPVYLNVTLKDFFILECKPLHALSLKLSFACLNALKERLISFHSSYKAIIGCAIIISLSYQGSSWCRCYKRDAILGQLLSCK